MQHPRKLSSAARPCEADLPPHPDDVADGRPPVGGARQRQQRAREVHLLERGDGVRVRPEKCEGQGSGRVGGGWGGGAGCMHAGRREQAPATAGSLARAPTARTQAAAPGRCRPAPPFSAGAGCAGAAAAGSPPPAWAPRGQCPPGQGRAARRAHSRAGGRQPARGARCGSLHGGRAEAAAAGCGLRCCRCCQLRRPSLCCAARVAAAPCACAPSGPLARCQPPPRSAPAALGRSAPGGGGDGGGSSGERWTVGGTRVQQCWLPPGPRSCQCLATVHVCRSPRRSPLRRRPPHAPHLPQPPTRHTCGTSLAGAAREGSRRLAAGEWPGCGRPGEGLLLAGPLMPRPPLPPPSNPPS